MHESSLPLVHELADTREAKPTVAGKKMAVEEKEHVHEQDDSDSAAYDTETVSDAAAEEVDNGAGPAPKHAKRVVEPREFYGKVSY